MGTHPIFESDFDCLTEMEAEAWKALKQAAIRFELKTGLNVHVSACRGERPVYEFTSSGKTNTDSISFSTKSKSNRSIRFYPNVNASSSSSTLPLKRYYIGI